MKRMIVGLILAIAPISMAFAQGVEGKWKLSDGTAIVEVYKVGDDYNGKIVWLKNPTEADGTPAIDDKNLVEGYYTLSNSGAWEVNVSNEKPITPCQSILVKTISSGEIVVNKTNQIPSNKSKDEKLLMVKASNKEYDDKANQENPTAFF